MVGPTSGMDEKVSEDPLSAYVTAGPYDQAPCSAFIAHYRAIPGERPGEGMIEDGAGVRVMDRASQDQ